MPTTNARRPIKCGAEEQTVDHVVLQSPIHRSPHEVHGMTRHVISLGHQRGDEFSEKCPNILNYVR